MIALGKSDISLYFITFWSYNYVYEFCFQGQQGILFLIIVVNPLRPRIKIMTAIAAVTVLWPIKEPGGTRAVTASLKNRPFCFYLSPRLNHRQLVKIRPSGSLLEVLQLQKMFFVFLRGIVLFK